MNNIEDNTNYNCLTNSIKSLQELRYHIKTIFNCVANGEGNSNEELSKGLLNELKDILVSFGVLEKNVNLLVPTNMTLGNLGYLSQDPLSDRNDLYNQALQSFGWFGMMQENAAAAASLLGQNSLKRATLSTNMSKKQKPSQNFPMLSHILDAMINGIDRLFLDMSVSTLSKRPYGSTLVLNVSLGTILRAVISLRNLMIEGIVIRGYNEKELSSDDHGNFFWSELVTNNKMDFDETHPELWVESRYDVFRKITDHAQAAMLHFYSPLIPELALKSFMTWLHSYASLFQAPCQRCQKHLQDFFPPTWRDFRTLEPYHELCKY